MDVRRMLSPLKQEFQPNRFLSSLTAGLVLGVISVLVDITPIAAATCKDRQTRSGCCGKKGSKFIASDLHRMQQENPQTAAAFSEFTNSLLAERLSQAQKEIENLLK